MPSVEAGGRQGRRSARPVLRYNLARLGLFVGCVVLGFVAGLRGFALLVAALVVSGILSWFLLARWRAEMADVVADAVTRGRSRLAARTEAEDAFVDHLPADPAGSGVIRPDR